MAEEKRAVYVWDDNKKFTSIKLVDPDYTLGSNETFTKPTDGLYDPFWNGTDWEGISQTEWEAKQPKVEVKPTAQQQQNANVTLQLATLTKQTQDLQKVNAQLTIDVANLKKQLDTKEA